MNRYDALAKVNKVIASCKTPEQVKVATKMVENYGKMYLKLVPSVSKYGKISMDSPDCKLSRSLTAFLFCKRKEVYK